MEESKAARGRLSPVRQQQLMHQLSFSLPRDWRQCRLQPVLVSNLVPGPCNRSCQDWKVRLPTACAGSLQVVMIFVAGASIASEDSEGIGRFTQALSPSLGGRGDLHGQALPRPADAPCHDPVGYSRSAEYTLISTRRFLAWFIGSAGSAGRSQPIPAALNWLGSRS
jgi:hypothetical protein